MAYIFTVLAQDNEGMSEFSYKKDTFPEAHDEFRRLANICDDFYTYDIIFMTRVVTIKHEGKKVHMGEFMRYEEFESTFGEFTDRSESVKEKMNAEWDEKMGINAPPDTSLTNVIKIAEAQIAEYQQYLTSKKQPCDEGTNLTLKRFIDMAKKYEGTSQSRTAEMNLREFARHTINNVYD